MTVHNIVGEHYANGVKQYTWNIFNGVEERPSNINHDYLYCTIDKYFDGQLHYYAVTLKKVSAVPVQRWTEYNADGSFDTMTDWVGTFSGKLILVH
ncbi:hypothetical protein [Anaerosacchariphilus polymeriproducens]|uniref:Uncharacterized protein n=1 Tax=Anaerosacchariphilus polymeriproducens TaxID=1812858 RepID=A0A371AR88_9FIRM|nr:hypothetical protein [Anaerosacchariphilus polymeriproducens]RDU22054.1 hypothetical protein DWV06_16100 [Anaerosacchariphilus polymeriproducens]